MAALEEKEKRVAFSSAAQGGIFFEDESNRVFTAVFGGGGGGKGNHFKNIKELMAQVRSNALWRDDERENLQKTVLFGGWTFAFFGDIDRNLMFY